MRDDPGLDAADIAACLDAYYGVRAAAIAFLPLGYDPIAAVYEVRARDDRSYFLKVRFGPVDEIGLLVPWALEDAGVREVVAPLRTRASALSAPLGGASVVLYPFVRGKSAAAVGLSAEQWRAFGASLRDVHDSGFEQRFRGRLPDETFALPSAALVRRLLAGLTGATFESAAATRFAAFWRERSGDLHDLLARAEALGARLRAKPFATVLCHADIHAGNILVGEDGRIRLIDWDGPLLAPRERDLLFVVGSKIARPVEPWEELRFFEGYGPIEIDPTALTYYRYERVIEDIGEFGKSVFLDQTLREETKLEAVELVMCFFAPDGMLDLAEQAPVLKHLPGVRARG